MNSQIDPATQVEAALLCLCLSLLYRSSLFQALTLFRELLSLYGDFTVL